MTKVILILSILFLSCHKEKIEPLVKDSITYEVHSDHSMKVYFTANEPGLIVDSADNVYTYTFIPNDTLKGKMLKFKVVSEGTFEASIFLNKSIVSALSVHDTTLCSLTNYITTDGIK